MIYEKIRFNKKKHAIEYSKDLLHCDSCEKIFEKIKSKLT